MKELPKSMLDLYTMLIQVKLSGGEPIDRILNTIFNLGCWVEGLAIRNSQRSDICKDTVKEARLLQADIKNRTIDLKRD